MKENKLKLQDLKVKSFMTSEKKDKKNKSKHCEETNTCTYATYETCIGYGC